MANRWMVDIETAATDPNAVVLSIGLLNMDTREAFIWYPDTVQQTLDGRTVDLETMKWWMEQSPEAREVFSTRTHPAGVVAIRLSNLLDTADALWANGPDFDCVILASFTKQYNKGYKWPFWIHRCFRTFKNVFSDFYDHTEAPRGTAHNALDDARYQASIYLVIEENLRKKGVKVQL